MGSWFVSSHKTNRLTKFTCKYCQVALTEEIAELQDHSLLDESDGKPHVPNGYFYLSQGQYWTTSNGNYLINLSDLQNIKHHWDTKRIQGCCGLDGTDGKNLLCINNHEIGTEHSDCWSAHFAELEPAEVIKMETSKHGY
jgi:hypothetical protein